MATRFAWYDDWRSATLECPRCGWKGTFDQGTVEQHDELMDSSCPACDALSAPMLAIVSFPTIEETEQNWAKATDEEKQFVQARKRRLADWEAASLQSGDQLPEWVGPAAALAWDCASDSVAGDSGKPSFTVIKHGDREIWREPICWEGYDRFREVVQILKQTYGKRLLDVVPTSASELYLFGDSITAHEYVEQVRRSLKETDARSSA